MYIFYSWMTLIPIMIIWSLYLLRKWKPIYRYTGINLMISFVYSYVILFSPCNFFEQDPLGLKKIFLFLMIIFLHAVGSFIFAVYYHFKLSKKWEPIEKS